MRVLAKCDGQDDVLFAVDDGPSPLALVHLTWNIETRPEFPHVSWLEDIVGLRDAIWTDEPL